MLEVSVIVPFYGDAALLTKCLDSIKNSTLNSEKFEVLVVDNHDDPKLPTDFFPPYRILYQKIPGSYAARNKAISEARGTYLFFTDADTTVASDWLEKGLEFLKEKGSVIAGGRIDLIFENPTSPRSLEQYEKIFYFQQKHYVEKEGYAATANLFGPKAIFDELQGFDSALRSGGDQEFCKRAAKLGHKVVYCHEAPVNHPSRPELKAFLVRRLRAFSGNCYLFYRRHGLNWKMVKEKLDYFLNNERFYDWNGDWDYFEKLSSEEKKKIRRWHRFFCWIDVLTLLYCKTSFKRMKKLTLIDRH